MKRAALAIVLSPLLAACGALIGAEWDTTLRAPEVDGSTAVDAASPVPDAEPDEADVKTHGTCEGKVGFCVCEAQKPKAGGVVCSLKTAGGGADFCCADKNWPISGKCTCSTFKCDPVSSDSCMCGSTEKGPSTTCKGALCCYSPGFAGCACYDTGGSTCPLQGDVEVAACSPSTIPCGPSEKRVESCGEVTP